MVASKPFAGASVPRCCILDKLLQPSEHYELTSELLQTNYTVFVEFSLHYLQDQLPGGAFHTNSEELRAQTTFVAKTNGISERDFAQLDRLLPEKPNALTVP